MEDDDDGPDDGADNDGAEDSKKTYEVERIVRTEKDRKTGERFYIVKWKDYNASHNTREPEEHLIENQLLISFWKGKKDKVPSLPSPLPPPQPPSTSTSPSIIRTTLSPFQAQLERVTKLQEAALAEKQKRKPQPLGPDMETPDAAAAPAAAENLVPPSRRPPHSACEADYDRAHAALSRAAVLVFDTETSGLGGCVLDHGWVLADSDGNELASYSKLWRLPKGERIHSRAYAAHRIAAKTVLRDGVDPGPELLEFYALVAAALALGVIVAAHNASFDVARLNHTAHRHQLRVAPLRSADLLCTMHNATRRCNLRKKGTKALKQPRNEELYRHFFNRKPPGPLHRALPDCRVTLACFVQGRELKWW